MPGRNAAGKAGRWADDRLGLAKHKEYLRKVFPDHWSFMLGEIALWSFVVLLITGVLLTLWFTPGMSDTTYHGSYAPLRGTKVSEAYGSVMHISFDVRGGLLVRQMHHWAANLFIASMFVHMIRVFVTGAFRKPREINWMIGGTMLFLGIVEGFAGYSLPDDLLSGTGLRIAEGLIQSIPVVGSYLTFFLFGGAFPGDSIVPRLFILHVLLLPGLLVALIGTHMLVLVYQKHTQWPGPGRATKNVVGYPMYPVYMAKSGGFFFIVFGVIAAMGALFTINPIWEYGPYDPAQVTADSQPDWYMGLPEGLLRIMPGYETRVFGHTVMWNVFIPGVLLPMLMFVTFLSYPFVAARVTRDVAEHHLLQRPRDAPRRTAFLVAMMTLYGLLWAAGGDDVLALKFHLDVFTLVETFRIAVFVGPVVAFIITRRWCVSLQRHDRERLVHGRETGVITRSPEGAYEERHERLDLAEAYRLTTRETDGVAVEATRRHGLNRRLAVWMAEDEVPLPDREELREAGYGGDAKSSPSAAGSDGGSDGGSAGRSDGDSPAADGHQFDGRRPVERHELRRR